MKERTRIESKSDVGMMVARARRRGDLVGFGGDCVFIFGFLIRYVDGRADTCNGCKKDCVSRECSRCVLLALRKSIL